MASRKNTQSQPATPAFEVGPVSFSSYLLLLLGAVFLFDLAGPVHDAFGAFVGIVALYLFFFSLNRPRTAPAKYLARALAGFAVTIAATVLIVAVPFTRPFAFALFVTGCALSRSRDPGTKAELDAMVLSATLFAVLAHLGQASGLSYYALDGVSRGVSGLMGNVLSRPLDAGETYAGTKTVTLFLLFVIAARAAAGRRRARDFAFPVLWILATWCVFLAYVAFLPDIHDFVARALMRSPNLSQTAKGSAMVSRFLLGAPLVLFALLLPALRFASGGGGRGEAAAGAPPHRARPLWRRAAPLVSAVVLSMVGFVLLARSPVAPAAEPGEVLLYEKGFLNWLVPHHGDYGEYSAGMFGNLPKHFQALGVPARVIPRITEEDLRSASGLVLINIDEEIPRQELEAAWNFVYNGGTLLVLGDHTFWKTRGVNWLNTCLEPFHIRYNFDSAQYFVGGWLNSYRFLQHPLTYGIGDERNAIGIVVGASLEVSPPAEALIVGTHGFSDPGNVHGDSTGYLGNLQYDRGEPLGDLVLAACQRYGKGRVLVFGDTSGFANPIAIWDFPFLRRVIAWMAASTHEGVSWVREMIAVLCLLGSVVLVSGRSTRAFGVLFLMPGLLVGLVRIQRDARALEIPPRGNVAYVDVSHAEWTPLEGWRKGGLMGLHLNLQRDGFLTYVLHHFDAGCVENADLLVMVSPTKAFTRPEINVLERFLEGGGKLLLCVGYEERSGSMGLLEELGLRVDSTPLGGFDYAASDTLKTSFVEAWPVYDASGTGTYVAHYEDYPVIVYKPIGKGGVLLVGDTRFFINENLEHDDHPHMESIHFLGYLVDNYLRRD